MSQLVWEDADGNFTSNRRGYTTRGKVEQARTAAPVFTGRVRRWTKQVGQVGHLQLLKWERGPSDPAGGDGGLCDTGGGGGGGSGTSARPDSAGPGEEPPRKRARTPRTMMDS